MKHITIHPKILLLAKAGDMKAFEHIVKSYFHPLYSYIYHMVGNKEETADLMQESFIKVYTHLKDYDPQKKFSTWLFTIVQRTVYDWLRKKRRTKEIFTFDQNHQLELSSKNEDLSEKMDIKEAFSHLAPEYKEVLFLYFWEGYSYKEIALLLHKPMNTVKTLLKRAKEKLRKEM